MPLFKFDTFWTPFLWKAPLFPLLATLCQSLILSLSPRSVFKVYTHTPPPSISFCSMKFWWIYQRSTILVAERQFKGFTQSSVSERDKMFCYINQNISYMDNGRNTPIKICISFVLPQQGGLKTYLIVICFLRESNLNSFPRSHKRRKYWIGEMGVFWGLGFFFKTNYPSDRILKY